MNKKIKTCVLVLSFTWASSGLARDASCDTVAGALIFKDMGYGILMGGILTGLALASQGDGEEVGQKMATGALVGAGLGAGLGFYELSTRDCSYVQAPGWQRPKLELAQNNLSVKLSYSF